MNRKLGSLTELADWKAADPAAEAAEDRRPPHRILPTAEWAPVAAALSTTGPLRDKLRACTDALVRHLDAEAARIWLSRSDGRTLILQAYSVAHSSLSRGGPRVPVASPALRLILEKSAPYVTSDVSSDPHLKDLPWGERLAYAGYPLLRGTRVIGVVAVFSRAPLRQPTLDTLRAVADRMAQAVEDGRVSGQPSRKDASSSEARRFDSIFRSLRRVIEDSHSGLEEEPEIQVLRDRYALLSNREREVMDLVVAGRLNKEVGDRLGISEITVKAHRGHMMRKMDAFSLADLVKIAVLLQLAP